MLDVAAALDPSLADRREEEDLIVALVTPLSHESVMYLRNKTAKGNFSKFRCQRILCKMISFSNFLDFACVDKKMQERKQKYTRYGVRGKKFHSFLKTSTVINVKKHLL